MKKGPAIVILVGLALLAFLYFLPVTPPVSSTEVPAENRPASGNETSAATADGRVDEAIRKLQSGEWPPMQAILQIRAVAEEYPDNVKAQYTLGVMSIQTAQYDKAIGRFEKVIALSPDNIDAYGFLAQARVNTGDTAGARKALETAYGKAGPEQRQEIEQNLKELSIN